MRVRAREVCETRGPGHGSGRCSVEPRAICCFYDLEDRTYNNSVARASSDTLLSPRRPPLLSPPRSPRPRFRPPVGGPPSRKSAGSPRVRARDTSPIRARPLLIPVLDGETVVHPLRRRRTTPSSPSPPPPSFVHLGSPSRFWCSRTEIRAATKAARRGR